MLFKIGVFLVVGFAIFVLLSAIYVHTIHSLNKIVEERDN